MKKPTFVTAIEILIGLLKSFLSRSLIYSIRCSNFTRVNVTCELTLTKYVHGTQLCATASWSFSDATWPSSFTWFYRPSYSHDCTSLKKWK